VKTKGADMETLLRKLEALEKGLASKRADLQIEDAVDDYSKYLRTKKKSDKTISVLKKFEYDFEGRNIAEITPEEVDSFITSHWKGSTANTLRLRHGQLSGLFNHAIKMLQRKGMPSFNNPMNFIKKPVYRPKDNVFIPAPEMKELIHSPILPQHKLWLEMLVTSGMRWEELWKLRVKDINGEVLTLIEPKSGKDKEVAVIPSVLAKRLKQWIADNRLRDDDKICPVSHVTFLKFTKKYTGLTPHYFRSWIATYWYRVGDYAMNAFVLRHATGVQDPTGKDKLHGSYVMQLTPKEAVNRQEKLAKEIL
jgi:integrase